MQATMETTPNATAVRAMRWSGRIISAIPALFLVMDGAIKLLNIQPVVDASRLLGLPVHLAPSIGILLLACLAIYLIPRTAIFGAILLTGYLGGAVAIHLRAESGVFPLIFPLVIGALLWGGLFLRDRQLRVLVSLRR